MNRYTYERSGQETPKTEFALSLHDGDKHYYIKLPVGKVMTMLKCRELLPDALSLSEMYRRSLKEDLDELLTTAYFNSLLNGDNITELLVSRENRRRKRKIIIKQK